MLLDNAAWRAKSALACQPVQAVHSVLHAAPFTGAQESQAVSVLGGPSSRSVIDITIWRKAARTGYRCSQIFYEVASSSVTLTAIQTCSYYIPSGVRNARLGIICVLALTTTAVAKSNV